MFSLPLFPTNPPADLSLLVLYQFHGLSFAIVVSVVAAGSDDGDSGSCCGVCASMTYVEYYTHIQTYTHMHKYTCVCSVCVYSKHINTIGSVSIMS